MKRLAIGLFATLLVSGAYAQRVVPPADTANCAFNTSPPTVASGNMIRIQCDAQGRLLLSPTGSGIVVSGNVSNASSGVATTSTNVPTVSYTYVWNGATWDQAAGLVVGTAGVPATQVVTVQSPASGGGFPSAATPISGNSTGTTGAVVGTLAAAGGKTTYICGFSISATGGVATLGPIVIAGLIGASQTYQLFSTATGANLNVPFTTCIPASATNTAITITTTADATASAVDVNSWGYQQ